MNGTGRALLGFEAAKLARAGVTRAATLVSLLLVSVTTVGGFASSRWAAGTDMGRQAEALITAPGWAGYVGLAGTSVGVTSLLAAGIVMAWCVGREFADGTIISLLAVPARPSAVATAKIAVTLLWTLLLSAANALLVSLGGLLLGLPGDGALAAGAAVALTGALLGAGALPVMWVATLSRGYLAGIGATLAIVVITNVGAGFGFGPFIPWAIPVLWAAPGGAVPTALLALPAGMALAGALVTCRAWARLQAGDR